MNKRNITLVTFGVAVLLTVGFLIPPIATWLNRWIVTRAIYSVSLLVASWVSGGHTPSVLAGWLSFAIWTLVHWAILWIGAAVASEMFLVRQAVHHLDKQAGDEAQESVAGEAAISGQALEKIGRTVREVEGWRRRRRHFLLQDHEMLDLNEGPRDIAVRALAHAPDERIVKRILAHYERRLAAKVGRGEARATVVTLQNHAKETAQRMAVVTKGVRQQNLESSGGAAGGV